MKAVVESNTHDSQIKTGNQRDEDMRYASEDTYLLVSLFSLSLPPGSEQYRVLVRRFLRRGNGIGDV